MPPGPGNAGGGPAAASNAAAMAAGVGGALPGGASNNASLRLPQMPNTNPLLTAAAKAAAASGGINLPLPWPQNMRPKEAMPISPPLTPLPATMRYVMYFFPLFNYFLNFPFQSSFGKKKNEINPYNWYDVFMFCLLKKSF